jgi:RsiW-degrading membrane proteinase PrsW (M82 family)
MPVAEVIDWSVALVPVLVMAGLFIWLDVFKLMTLWETLGLLALGAVSALAAFPVSGVFLDQLPLGFSDYSRFAAPWIEEMLKGVVIAGLFAFNRIGFKLDAVISGFAVGAGFSVVENIIYLTRFPELAAPVWMVRGLGTAVMHGTTLAILASIAHEFAERETREAAREYRFNLLWFIPGLLAAVALHTLFNQFPERPVLAMSGTLLFAPLALMAIFRFGAGEAQQWLSVDRDTHRAQLEILRAGKFPDDASGRRVAALAARCDPRTASRIREYCAALTALVLAAEDALLQQASDSDRVSVDAAAEFKRADDLRRQLGASTLAVLTPLLPFSRNDYWELSKLNERLARNSEGRSKDSTQTVFF